MTCMAPIPSVITCLSLVGWGVLRLPTPLHLLLSLWRSDSEDKMSSFVRAPRAGLSLRHLRAQPASPWSKTPGRDLWPLPLALPAVNEIQIIAL